MLKWVGGILFVATFSAGAMAFEVEETFNKTCAICHVPGVAMAPKVGDAAAWEPRLALGMDALVKSVVNGKGAMPPKGMCSNCDEAQFAELIKHMLPK